MQRPSLSVIPFRNTRRPLLQLPGSFSADVKTAQISALPEFESVQPFRQERWQQLEVFSPNVLVGYAYDLRRLAEQVLAGRRSLSSVDRAIYALTDCGSNTLTESLRDQLWHVFGVPLYELIVAPGCRLLAAECEAHDGWHLQSGIEAYRVGDHLVYDTHPLRGLYTGFKGQIDPSPCACGRPSMRLKGLAPHLPRPYERSVAAVA